MEKQKNINRKIVITAVKTREQRKEQRRNKEWKIEKGTEPRKLGFGGSWDDIFIEELA